MPEYILTGYADGEAVEAALDKAESALQPADVDDAPVDDATEAPISSNWAHDHAGNTEAHGASAFGATLKASANAAAARSTLGLGTAATTDASAYATAAQGGKADTAHGWGNHADAGYVGTTDARLSDARTPTAPAWSTLTTTGTDPAVTLTVPLDGGSYECQIPAGSIDVLAYTLPANDATSKQYGALLKITAPASGTETVAIPTGWLQAGPLDAISLDAGDDPILVILATDNDSDSAPAIIFTAQQLVETA